jgi:hypothetical protein
MTDMAKILEKLEVVKEIPKTNRGGLRHTWKPLLDSAIGKGILRISEDDISIQSALNGLKKEADKQNTVVILNTRKINGKLWLFIQAKPKPKK